MFNFSKQLITVVVSCIFLINFCGGELYADTITYGSDTGYSSTTTTDSGVSNSTTTGKVTIKGRTTERTTKTTTIGTSGTGQIVVTIDNLFTGLDTLVTAYAPTIDIATKELLLKSLGGLVLGVVTGDTEYTVSTFKTAFVDTLVKYGVQVNDDCLDAIDKYIAYYLDDQFEQNDSDTWLSMIYVSLTFVSTILLLIWIRG